MEIPYIVQPRRDTGLYNAKVGIWLFLASEVMLFGALFSSYILLRVGATEWPHGMLNIPIGTLNTVVLITSSITVVMSWVSCKLGQFSRYRLYQACTILLALTFVVIKSFEYSDKWTHYEVTFTDGRKITGHIERNPMFWTRARLDGVKDAKTGQLLKPPVEEITFTPDPPKGQPHGAHPPAMKIARGDIKKLECYGPFHNTYFAIYFTLTGLHALHVIGGALVIGWIWGPGAKLWATDPARYTNRVEVSGLFWHFVDLVWIFLFPVLYLL